ncbi:hypothetical protein PCC7424_5612 (plasmid) [Gloeothece citriformis PCC 7424]|uniref:DUF4164 domain-containing protein n=1 Tax=Gloeothece citriformis (strain PCC 7424) TaxID=65393 RepID=B7KMZ9_GLOC7|nr:hypothetical protein [Gloeothece citriformis]ACK74171.1 hypothetical protein PCC7424_5612 [Gloeothece citriformis PCC 7424]
MSQSPINVTYSLEEVLKQINQKLDNLDTKFTAKIDNLQKDVTDLKIGQARLEEKVDGLGKRLDFQEFINKGVLVGLVVAILGGAAKLFGWVGNP